MSQEPRVSSLRPIVDLDRLRDAIRRGTGKGVKVAVIDSGVDGNHPAFAGKLKAHYDVVVELFRRALRARAADRQHRPWHRHGGHHRAGRPGGGAHDDQSHRRGFARNRRTADCCARLRARSAIRRHQHEPRHNQQRARQGPQSARRPGFSRRAASSSRRRTISVSPPIPRISRRSSAFASTASRSWNRCAMTGVKLSSSSRAASMSRPPPKAAARSCIPAPVSPVRP